MFHQKIQESYAQLSKREREIATYLLNQNDLSPNFHITELAENTHSSPATITRFVYKLGFDSFVDFKIYYSTYGITDDIEETDIQQRVFKLYQNTVRRTNEMTNLDYLEQSVEAINQASNIYVIGVGSSGFSAAEFSMRLVRMGINAVAWTDVHMILLQCGVLKKGDLVITLSASGQTYELVEALELAQQNEAKIITMTSSSHSPVARLGDICIEVASSLLTDSETMINTQFSILYQIDIITNLLLASEDKRQQMDATIEMIIKQKYLHD